MLVLVLAIRTTYNRLLTIISKPFVLLFVLGYLVLMIVPEGLWPLGHAFVVAGYIFFDDLTWLVKPDVMFRSRKGTPYVFGKGRLLCQTAVLAGFLGGYAVISHARGPLVFPVSSLACVVLMVLSGTVVFTKLDMDHLIESHQNLDARETLLERCRSIAEVYRLTARE